MNVKSLSLNNWDMATIDASWNDHNKINVEHREIDPREWCKLLEYHKQYGPSQMQSALKDSRLTYPPENGEMFEWIDGCIAAGGETHTISFQDDLKINEPIGDAGEMEPDGGSVGD
jgi:hypothetical protein